MPFSARAIDRLALGLALLRAINAAQADTFRAVVVQDFDGVAVEDGDDGVGEVSERGIGERRRTKHVSSSHVTMPSLGG
jgi:hypothetical protein